jgi:hypothetical protein
MRSILIALVLCWGAPTAISATAQEKPLPAKTDLGFDASKVPAQDPKLGKPVARVLNQYIYRKDFGGNVPRDDADARYKLQGLIFAPLLDRFVERETIAATPDEIEKARQFVDDAQRRLLPDLKPEGSPEQMADALREVGEELVIQWKCNRVLYKRYGGAVIFQQGNPLEPVGAYRRFLEDVERGGAFEIYHPEDRKAFYDYFTRDHGHWFVPKDLIDYEIPWWLQTDDQKSKWPRRAADAEKPNQQKATK